MTWTAEQEAKYRELETQASILGGEIGRLETARRNTADRIFDNITEAQQAGVNGRVYMIAYLRARGAELIALIEPFVERKA